MKRHSKKKKCTCAYQYCCDHCWQRAAKKDPCRVPGCLNPYGHIGPHGELRNTQVLRITEKDLLPLKDE